MRSLLFTLMFIPLLANAEVIKLKEPCADDQGNQVTNLKQCDVMINELNTNNVITTLTIPASSATGCQIVSVDTATVDKLIEGSRTVSATCTSTSGRTSAVSNSLSHIFRGRPTAAPTVQEIQSPD